MNWLDIITEEKRARKDGEEAQSALATDRYIQYQAKVKLFWQDLSARLIEDLERYNANVPAECAVHFESLLEGTRLIIATTVPPPRSLTVQFNFQGQRVSCYQAMQTKTEQRFRVEVGRDGTLALFDIGRNKLVPPGDEGETILGPFLKAI